MTCIICYGNPSDGFFNVGPFDNAESANEYLDKEYSKENAWVIELQEPAKKVHLELEAGEQGLILAALDDYRFNLRDKVDENDEEFKECDRLYEKIQNA